MGKWEMVRLGDVCKVVTGMKTPSTDKPELWEGDIKWVIPADVTDDMYYIYETKRHISEKIGLKPMTIGTVLLSTTAPIGKVVIVGDERMCCNFMFRRLICSDNVYNCYLYHYLRSQTEYLNSLGRGTTVKGITSSIILNIEIPLPPLHIQQEISEFLDHAKMLVENRKAQVAKQEELYKALIQEYIK